MADSLRLGGKHPEADLLNQFPYLLFLVYGIYSGASLPPSWILNVFNIGRREGKGRFDFPHWEYVIYDCPVSQVKKTEVQPDCSFAPTQLALCLRLATT